MTSEAGRTTPLGAVLAALRHDGAGGYVATPPASWHQGRTLYGGLTAALCARAARLAEPEPGPLRALQMTFLAPSTGTVRLLPQTLRRGRSATFTSVDCETGGAVSARAMLTYGRSRDVDPVHDRLPPPEVPPAEDCPPLTPPPFAPAFLAHMQLRFAGGTPPFTAGHDPAFAMWVRHLETADLDPESALLAVADVLPPAAAAVDRAPRPVSSVTWSIDLAPPLAVEQWYLLHTASDHAAEGYSLQAMTCFAPDGRLLAVGRQTVAIF